MCIRTNQFSLKEPHSHQSETWGTKHLYSNLNKNYYRKCETRHLNFKYLPVGIIAQLEVEPDYWYVPPVHAELAGALTAYGVQSDPESWNPGAHDE